MNGKTVTLLKKYTENFSYLLWRVN